jgi:hypothetical protein
MQGIKLQQVGSGLSEKPGSRLDGNQQAHKEKRPINQIGRLGIGA